MTKAQRPRLIDFQRNNVDPHKSPYSAITNSHKTNINFIKEYPEIKSMSIMKEDLTNRRVYIIEKIMGKTIAISYNPYGKNFILKANNKEIINLEEFFGVKSLFIKMYEKKFHKLANIFNNVKFIVYCKLIGNEVDDQLLYFTQKKEKAIIPFDIYINGNWIFYDDFIRFTEAAELTTPPILTYIKEGFSQETAKKVEDMIKNFSILSKMPSQPIGGLIIRPEIEDSSKNFGRVIAKIKNIRYIKATKKQKENFLKKNYKVVDSIKTYLNALFTKYEIDRWFNYFGSKGITINKNNLNTIIPTIVNDYLDSKKMLFKRQAASLNIDIQLFKFAVKSLLPKIIISKLNIN